MYYKTIRAFAVSAVFFLSGCLGGGSSFLQQSSTLPTLDLSLSRSQGFTKSAEANGGYYKVGTPYKIEGQTYKPRESFSFVEIGVASWYGPNFHGKLTANGEKFDQYALTAAHRTLQMPSLAKVTNLENGREIIVRINDRGPFAKDRVLDLSRAAAERLDMIKKGTARVRIVVLGRESLFLKEVALKTKSKATSVQHAALTANTSATPLVSDSPLLELLPEGSALPVASVSSSVTQDQKASSGVLGFGTSAAAATLPQSSDVSASKGDEPSETQDIVNISDVYGNVFFVQVGAFEVPKNAQTLKKKLSAEYSVKVFSSRDFEHVMVGPFQTEEDARANAFELIDKFNVSDVFLIW